jgi:hypothetical protein
MEDNPDQPLDRADRRDQPSPPRRFVYRSAEPDSSLTHPLRRSTDTPRPFQGVAGQLCPKPVLLKFRVYMKLN